MDEVDFDRIVAGNTNDDVPGLVLEGGLDTLQTLANVPKTWPLARLTIPLSGFNTQLERLVEGYCMEVMATNAQPDQHLLSIKTFAKDLVLLLAFHLAERISSLLRHVLDHSKKVLCDPERAVTYKIQKWNVRSERVHPILVANTQVDWLALADAEISQNFPILREDILQDVFSQRASSAWQGAQPPRVTVALLLPGSGTAEQWLDFLQSQRKSKHLWDTINIKWSALSKKLYVSKPSGLSHCGSTFLSPSTVRIHTRSVNCES